MLYSPTRRTSALLLAFIFSLFASRFTSAAETFRYKFNVGQKLKYAMTQKMTQTKTVQGVAPQVTVIHQSTDMTWHVTKVLGDGNAVIDQTIDRIRIHLKTPTGVTFKIDSQSEEVPEGPVATMLAPMMKAMTGVTFQVTMSPLGEVVDLVIPDALTKALQKSPNAAQMGEMLTKKGFSKMVQQGALVFPKDDIVPDFEWTKSLEMENPMLGGKQTIATKYRYIGPEERDGTKLEKFSVQLQLDFGSGDESKTSQLTILNQKSKGSLYFDRNAGRMKSATVELAMDMAIQGKADEFTMHLDQTIQTTVTPISE